jgi:hypothetical protein
MKRTVLFLVGLMVFTVGSSRTAQADGHEAVVYVVHGIPGQDLDLDPALRVDVSVGGACALPGFAFGDIVGPLNLPADIYDIAISLENEDDPCGSDPVIEASVELMGGANYSIVAYLADDGTPTAGLFENDVTATGRGKARLIVQHTANAPGVDISVRRDGPNSPGLDVFDFFNGDQAQAEVRPGEWNVAIFPAGGIDPVFGPVTVELKPYAAYLVFAVGSLDTGSFTLLLERIDGLKPMFGGPYNAKSNGGLSAFGRSGR